MTESKPFYSNSLFWMLSFLIALVMAAVYWKLEENSQHYKPDSQRYQKMAKIANELTNQISDKPKLCADDKVPEDGSDPQINTVNQAKLEQLIVKNELGRTQIMFTQLLEKMPEGPEKKSLVEILSYIKKHIDVQPTNSLLSMETLDELNRRVSEHGVEFLGLESVNGNLVTPLNSSNDN